MHKDPLIIPRKREEVEDDEARSTYLVPERRVEAMKNLGDLRLAIGGREKDSDFGD